jgi:F-type H+-transporting ATPase subunit epsilon
MKYKIIDPERIIGEGEATMVVVKTSDGEMGFMEKHIPTIAPLGFGEARIHTEKEVIKYFIDGGYVQTNGEEILILARKGLAIDEIDVQRAKRKIEEIEKEIKITENMLKNLELKNRISVLKTLIKVGEENGKH